MDSARIGGTASELAVDIVITNHNYGEYLAEAIESALAQTHPRLRTIVVDDGSTDRSREVLQGYDGSVEAILKENGGQASALNAGLERCGGEVVMLLDSDDVLRPGAAEEVATAFAARPDAVKTQFRMEFIDSEGQPAGVTRPAAHVPMPEGDVRRAELTFPFDLTWMATSANAFRLSALRRILPIPEREFRRCPDWYLVHLAALLGPVVSLPYAGVARRVHGANSYEAQQPRLDLRHVRQGVSYAGATRASLAELAGDLDLDHAEPILSMADLANRIVSLRLEPELHPVPSDSRSQLMRSAVKAAGRRFDVGWPMKAMFVAWYAAVAVAPRRLVTRLAELFLFPERRRPMNALLGRLHREPRSG